VTTPSNTALLVMDVQNGIVQNFPADKLLEQLPSAVEAARKADVPVLFVGVKFRSGHPEISPNNRMWAPVAANNGMLEDSEGTQFAAELSPQSGDVVVAKRRVGAFSGSDLDTILRARGITHIVLSGISTSGVVLSTLRLAADMDYRITVLSDGVVDNDEELHNVLVTKLFPRQAEVVSIADWIGSLQAA
jgi:nicotinamidase-related amidase